MSAPDGYQPPGGMDRTKSKIKVIDDRQSLRNQLKSPPTSIDGSFWVSGVLAALQSVLFGVAIIVIPALTTAVISTTFVNQQFEFGAAFGAGMSFWVLGHGMHVAVQGATVSLVPLGLSLLLMSAGAISVRRTIKPGVLPSAWYAGTYLFLVLVISLAVGKPGAKAIGTCLLATTLIIAGSLALGLRKRRDCATYRGQVAIVLERIPDWVRIGLKQGLITVGLFIVIGSLTLGVWLILGMERMAQVLGQWSLDAPSGLAMGVSQVALVPNLILWATAWADGSEFTVGIDTSIAMTHAELGPVPALPVLGALPSSAVWPVWQYLLPSIMVGSAMVGAILFARFRPRLTAIQVALVPVIGVATVAASFALLFALTSGSAGPGRLAQVGVPIIGRTGMVALLSAIGFVVVALVSRPEVRDWARQGATKLLDRTGHVEGQEYGSVPGRTPAGTEQSPEPESQDLGPVPPPAQ